MILGDCINIRYCYSHPYLSLNLRQFWKRWSLHVGEPLANYVYIPFGGNKNPWFSSLMVFFINGLDHIGFAAILDDFKWDDKYIKIGKAFAILGGGTMLDSFLYVNFVKNKQNACVANVLRFVLMYAIIIGQAMLP